MAFNFFEISDNFLDKFDGIAGSIHKATLELTTITYQEGEPYPIETKTIINNVKCLISDMSKTQLKYTNSSIMDGRRNVNVRIENKSSILQKIKQKTFTAMKNNKSYIIFNNHKYNIVGWQDFINADFIHFYCVSVDD